MTAVGAAVCYNPEGTGTGDFYATLDGRTLTITVNPAAVMNGATALCVGSDANDQGADVNNWAQVVVVARRVPFFGGSAADNEIAGKWWLYNGTECFQDGCIVAFFYTDTPMVNKFTGAYAETDKFGIVTKMDGDRGIAEICGKPALDVYADWRGMDTSNLMGGDLLVASIVAPLGVKDRLGDLIAIRHPMNGNDDLSIAVGAKVAEKTAVILMDGDVDVLVGSVEKTAGELKEKAAEMKVKLPTKDQIRAKLPTKEQMIRLNPFRTAEIEAEYADYADVD